MNKIVYITLLMLAGFISCTGQGGKGENGEAVQADTIAGLAGNDTLHIKAFTGIAVDGAMNSIMLVADGDTMSFSYPDLDRESIDSWEIGDTVTVQYFASIDGDSVVRIEHQ